MPTLKVLSWNIEKLGNNAVVPVPKGTPKKGAPQTPAEIIRLIGGVITDQAADVVGIMEVVAGMGPTIMRWLIADLNARPGLPVGASWKGIVSARQDGRPQEEYIYLWKSTATFDVDMTAPWPALAVGVADTNLFLNFAASVGIAADQINNFTSSLLQSLQTNGVVTTSKFGSGGRAQRTKTLRVNPNLWGTLTTLGPLSPAPVTTPPVSFTSDQLTQLTKILVDVDILRFLTFGERSPYLLRLQANGKPLTVALYHTLGSSDPDRFSAINVLGLSPVLAPATTGAVANVLIMGDFNVRSNEFTTNADVFGRIDDGGGKFSFARVSGVPKQVVFGPIKGAPINANAGTMADAKTSLIKTFIANGSPVDDALANTFDNFYYRQSTTNAITIGNSQVISLLQQLLPGVGVNAALAQSTLKFFASVAGQDFIDRRKASLTKDSAKDQKDLIKKRAELVVAKANLAAAAESSAELGSLQNRVDTLTAAIEALTDKLAPVQAQLDSLDATLSLLQNPLATGPAGIGDALTMFRRAISDHLPITTELTV